MRLVIPSVSEIIPNRGNEIFPNEGKGHPR